MLLSSSVRCGLIAGLIVLSLDTNADESTSPNASMRYAAANMQCDGDGNRESTAALSLLIGEHAWAHAGVGKIRAQQGDSTVDPTLISTGMGIVRNNLEFTLDFDSRKDGDRYRQRDWNSAVEWHNETVSVGVDGMHRNTKVQAMVPIANQGSTINVPVTESLVGNGIGLHARFNASNRLSFSLAGMHFSYNTHDESGAVATNGGLLDSAIGNALNNRPLLAQQLLIQAAGVTREAAILQRSWNAGMSYRLDRAVLTAQYFNDKALVSEGVINTVQVGAAIFLDKHWAVLPAVGQSHSQQAGNVAFGSLTVSYGW